MRDQLDITFKTRTQVKTGSGRGRFLLANKKGGYLFLGENNFTHYTGLYFFLPEEWELYKTIADIRLDNKPSSIKNKFYLVQRNTNKAQEEFFNFGKTMYYSVNNYQGRITIDLDMRRIHDDNTKGRVYRIYWEEGFIIVEYRKYRSDDHTELVETNYLVIKGVDRFTLLNQWEPRTYPFDAARGEIAQRWVYKALSIDCEQNLRITFTFGQDKESAMREAENNWNDWNLVRSRLKNYSMSVKTTDDVTYSSAVFALESLVTSLNGNINRTGIYAGLPWFFQFWSRDELISLRGLILTEKYSLVKDIILRYSKAIGEDGRLPNRLPQTGLGSADSIGWLWKRLGDLIKHLEEERLLFDYFSEEELKYLAEQLKESIRRQTEHHLKDDLILNGPKETWMDTTGGTDDCRSGARIEIQALVLASIRTYLQLQRILKFGNGRMMKELKEKMTNKIRKEFFKEGSLFDGIKNDTPDKTIRPNVFLAAYAYEELFTRKEWKTIFNDALKKLWLEWGGLSTIDKRHPLYKSWHTGKDDRSYHRGDSWYFVNNIAAIVLNRIDPEEYNYYIKSITNASSNELLWSGINGHCAEISSASEQTSQGSLAQAWSAATLIELLHETDPRR